MKSLFIEKLEKEFKKYKDDHKCEFKCFEVDRACTLSEEMFVAYGNDFIKELLSSIGFEYSDLKELNMVSDFAHSVDSMLWSWLDKVGLTDNTVQVLIDSGYICCKSYFKKDLD